MYARRYVRVRVHVPSSGLAEKAPNSQVQLAFLQEQEATRAFYHFLFAIVAGQGAIVSRVRRSALLWRRVPRCVFIIYMLGIILELVNYIT